MVLSRRCLVLTAISTACVSSIVHRASATASEPRIVNLADHENVDPTGVADSAPGFQAALNKLQNKGGGQLHIPAGTYVVSQPLTYSGASLSIVGAGQGLSVILVKTPINVLTITLVSTGMTFSARDFGFAPVMSPAGGTAITINGVNSGSTTQSCIIENVDFSTLYPGYTAFGTALALKALQRVNIRNVNMHGNAGITAGATFATLSGCIDVRFNNCSIDIVDTAFLVAGYCEGLHLVDTVVANATTAIATGSTAYSGNGTTTPFVNLLGLYIADCEFNCVGGSADLNYVVTAWLSNTHFSTGNVNAPALSILGSSGVQVANCEFTGQFNNSTPQNWTGVVIGGLNGWASDLTVIDGCLFTNLGLGISILPNAFNTSALGVRMSYGAGLIGNPVTIGTYTIMACHDTSGSSSNIVQTVASQAAAGNTTTHLTYSQP